MEHEWTDANGSKWKVNEHGVWFWTVYDYWELTHPSRSIGAEFLRLVAREKELEADCRQPAKEN